MLVATVSASIREATFMIAAATFNGQCEWAFLSLRRWCQKAIITDTGSAIFGDSIYSVFDDAQSRYRLIARADAAIAFDGDVAADNINCHAPPKRAAGSSPAWRRFWSPYSPRSRRADADDKPFSCQHGPGNGFFLIFLQPYMIHQRLARDFDDIFVADATASIGASRLGVEVMLRRYGKCF